MIPRTLEQWSPEALLDLLDKHYFEPETFDFKEMLPHKNDDKGKLRCASRSALRQRLGRLPRLRREGREELARQAAGGRVRPGD